jgi:hypothetical protein
MSPLFKEAIATEKPIIVSFSGGKTSAYMAKTFGIENITAGKILLSNVEKYETLTKAVTGTNTAYEQAAIQTDNLSSSYKFFKNAWSGLMLSVEDGGGVFSSVWKGIIDGATDAINWFSDFIERIKTGFADIYNSSAMVRGAIQGFGAIVSSAFHAILLPAKEFFNAFGGIAKIMKAVLTKNFDDVPGIIKDTLTKGKEIAQETGKKIGDSFTNAWDKTVKDKIVIPPPGQSPAEKKAAKEFEAQQKKATEEQTKTQKAAAEKAANDLKKIAEEQAQQAQAQAEHEYQMQLMFIDATSKTKEEADLKKYELEKSYLLKTFDLLQAELNTFEGTELEKLAIQEKINKARFNTSRLLC